MNEKKNFSIRIDLKKLTQVAVTNMKGKNGDNVPVVIIPINPNGIFVGEKGTYLNLAAFEMSNPQFKQTHIVKRSLTEEEQKSMSEEEKQAMPIIGNMTPIESKEAQPAPVTGCIASEEIQDDLPF